MKFCNGFVCLFLEIGVCYLSNDRKVFGLWVFVLINRVGDGFVVYLIWKENGDFFSNSCVFNFIFLNVVGYKFLY